MSLTTQEKFMAQMEAIAEEFGLDFVCDSRYANTGTIRFQPQSSFSTLVEFSYDFQSGYASFNGFPSFGQPTDFTASDGRKRVRGHYVEAAEMDATIAFIRTEVRTSLETKGIRPARAGEHQLVVRLRECLRAEARGEATCEDTDLAIREIDRALAGGEETAGAEGGDARG
jgi:hypothetical protein